MYEVIIETKICVLFSNHQHNRDGLLDAFARIGEARTHDTFIKAKIISSRDGIIFESED
ncbi:MAG: hypothetical protein RL316_1398 [Bacteroidota bacterium]|jgi:hypothetical protein